MIALQIDIDGERYVTAGAEDWSLLNAFVDLSRAGPGEDSSENYMQFRAGGLSKSLEDGVREHLRWGERSLKLGSVVTISIVETGNVDSPKKRYRSDNHDPWAPFTEEELREMKYRDYLALKEEFEGKADG